MCGEAVARIRITGAEQGPSPRVRGSHPGRRRQPVGVRSIPACAGKPRSRCRPRRSGGVHPRVCGEARTADCKILSSPGPSPRVRGSPERRPRGGHHRGSIPACAGKPGPDCSTGDRGEVHPRVCGEAGLVEASQHLLTGPSPRVRGSHRRRRRTARGGGAIPACAGKPSRPSPGPACRGVHPRVCGEAGRVFPEPAPAPGPSPRVRGSPSACPPGTTRWGSIPACAGKPSCPPRTRRGRRVHPRVCGEAGKKVWGAIKGMGPSPRVRGSQDLDRGEELVDGSIPACAGKPGRRRAGRSPARVHPRVCGEAGELQSVSHSPAGPSPRVRGSRAPSGTADGGEGSIPACAGKPVRDDWSMRAARVHPRVCGEASIATITGEPGGGPSPRVRGSLHAGAARPPVRGSIPACAGKPARTRSTPRCSRVHPRVCGEAVAGDHDTMVAYGPSPRVRGSRATDPAGLQDAGSIPACAGKPP